MSEGLRSRRVLRWLLPLVLLPVFATVAIYLSNPLGTASADPRARLLGYLLARFPSESMRPTITPGDILYIDTTAYWNNDPATGDLLMFRTAAPPYSDYLYRVVAVPGDRVDVRGGNVWVNGMALVTGITEDEWPSRSDAVDRIVVPAGEYFLVGDNPRRSADSRVLGTVPRSRAIGRATHVVSGARPGPLPLAPMPSAASSGPEAP